MNINNSACMMRDELKKAWYERKITLADITTKLSKIDLPTWLQSEILHMVNHLKYDRCTCPVEQAMESAVHHHILNEITSVK
jgi:hypothetical protein